jgi:spermine/spermidine synthase
MRPPSDAVPSKWRTQPGDVVNAGKLTHAGLFFLTLAVLMYEVLLTRIFSVTMWYHFAFVAISMVLFGIALGAILVYLFPSPANAIKKHLALSGLCFAATTAVSFLIYLQIPQTLDLMSYLFLTYVVTSAPFIVGGFAVALALTRFPNSVGSLYAADLAGAAIGCVAVILALTVTDGPGAVMLVALFGSVAAVFFAIDARAVKLVRAAFACCALFGLLAEAQAISSNAQSPLIRITWAKGGVESASAYQRWNSFSRVRVGPHTTTPFGWGLSADYPEGMKVRQLGMNIDGSAFTVITAYGGDLRNVTYLKYDITNLVHYVRNDAHVLVIGAGGGRDVLSALEFGQRSIVAVEINRNIVDTVNGEFGDFSGHLDQNPRVRFVNDEARSYVARSRERFDVIQASLVDTWAATGAGAFALTENAIYTVEAWQLFLTRLTPHGVLSFSYWYINPSPREMYRLTALASAALKNLGVRRPRHHIIIVRTVSRDPRQDQREVGTLLVGKRPFSPEEVDTVRRVAQQLGFQVVVAPQTATDSALASLASGADPALLSSMLHADLRPPTDDHPFFFQMDRVSDVMGQVLRRPTALALESSALYVLGILLVIVVFLVVLCLIVPLAFTANWKDLAGTTSAFTYFSSIGLGYLLIEISQLQRLGIFLGHPTYSLSIVLFTLLLSSGLGSYLTARMPRRGWTRTATLCLGLLLVVLFLYGQLAPRVILMFQQATIPARAVVAIGLLAPMGVLMGMPFPFGMRGASARPSITPWLWGMNGAQSVCASVLAIIIAISASISAAYWTGVAAYACAAIAFGLGAGSRRE